MGRKEAMKEKIKLSGVPETMLQTIYARAKESRGRGIIHDAKAEEIIEKLDYDFSLADKDTAMHSGVIARTIVLDRLTKEWRRLHQFTSCWTGCPPCGISPIRSLCWKRSDGECHFSRTPASL